MGHQLQEIELGCRNNAVYWNSGILIHNIIIIIIIIIIIDL